MKRIAFLNLLFLLNAWQLIGAEYRTLILKDDFFQADNYLWKGSTHTVKDGILTSGHGNLWVTEKNNAYASLAAPAVTFKARRVDNSCRFDVMTNRSSDGNYRFVFKPNELSIEKQGSKNNHIQKIKFDFQKDRWFEFSVGKDTGHNLSIRVDGKKLAEWQDPVPLKAGTLCLNTGKNPDVQFDEIKVEERFTGNQVVRFTDFKDKKLPDWLFQHLSEWQLEDGCIKTSGPSPDAGWFLCTTNEQQVHKVSFKVKKDQSGGLVSLRSDGWRLLLRDDHLMLKTGQAHFIDIWVNTMVRKIDFTPGKWHELTLQFNIEERSVEMSWDGKPLEKWTSALDGCWKGIGYDDELRLLRISMGRSTDILAFHAWQTPATFTDIKLEGIETGKAKYVPRHCLYPHDLNENYERIAPLTPVSIEPAKSADGSGVPEELSHSKYTISKANPPFKAKVKIVEPGDYTLQMTLSLIKNTNINLAVKINGKTVSNEYYHGLTPSSIIVPAYDCIPLRLKPGVYEVEISGGSRVAHMAQMGRINLSSIKLVKGIDFPAYTVNVNKPQPPQAMKGNLYDCELFGKILKFNITGLEQGNYRLRLKAAEMLLDQPGQRLMNVFIDNKPVAENWDILKESGRAMKGTEKEFPLEISHTGAVVELKLVGVNFPACLHGLEIEKDGKILYSENIGWSPHIDTEPNFGPINRTIDSYGTYFNPAKNMKTKIFSGHNSIANPEFSLAEKNNIPVGWRSIGEMEKNLHPYLRIFGGQFPGTADYSISKEQFRSAPSSLEVRNVKDNFALTGIFCDIDYNKKQDFSIWVKTENANDVFLEIYWLKRDKIRDLIGLTPFKILKSDRSDSLSGTNDWTKLSINVQPPFDAITAVPVLRVGANSGKVFFDDATLDLYGADELDIIWSHAGYSSNESKRIFARAMNQAPVTVELKNLDTGEITARQDAEFRNKEQYPARYYYACDFSGTTQPGRYVFIARQGKFEFTSDEFRIKPDLNRETALAIRRTLYMNRLNSEIKNSHELDWLEFATARVNRIRFDANLKADLNQPPRNIMGGWYDASDWCRFNNQQVPSIFALLNMAEAAPGDAATLDELAWGLKGFLRITEPEGYSYQRVMPFVPDQSVPPRRSNLWIDWRQVLPHSAGMFAMSAELYKDLNPDLSAECLAKAKGVYFRMTNYWREKEIELIERSEVFRGLFQKPYNQLHFAPKVLWAAIYLWRITGEEQYRKDIDQYADMLISGLKNRGYLAPEYAEAYQYRSACVYFDYIWVSDILLKKIPDYSRKAELKNELEKVFGEMKRLCKQSIYETLPAMVPAEKGIAPEVPTNASHISYLSNAAYCMKLGSRMFDDKELTTLAERQLQYIFGCNQYNISMAGGVGKRFAQKAISMQIKPEYFRHYLKSGQKFIYGMFIAAGTGWGANITKEEKISYNNHRFGYIVGNISGSSSRLVGPTSYAVEGAGPEIYLPFYSNLMLGLLDQ